MKATDETWEEDPVSGTTNIRINGEPSHLCPDGFDVERARLALAAPELYRALEALAEQAQDRAASHGETSDWPILRAAKAALKKARGDT